MYICECKYIKCAECAYALITLKCVQSISDAITFFSCCAATRTEQSVQLPVVYPVLHACSLHLCLSVYTSLQANHLVHTNYVVVFALIDLILIMNVPFVQ